MSEEKPLHLMLDLETLGVTPSSAILSAAAVLFDPMGIGPADRVSLQATIDLDSCLKCGRTVNASTVYFWLLQEEAPRLALCQDEKVSLSTFLYDFTNFWNTFTPEAIWANGANFDTVLLTDSYRALGLEPPFKYYQVRCVRTLTKILGKNVFMYHPHNPLEDCLKQIADVQACYHRLQDGGLL